MKKLIAIAFASAITMFGATESFAQEDITVEDCAESDTTPEGVECPVDVTPGEDGVYPPVEGTGGTVPPAESTTTTTQAPAGTSGTVPGSLPRTGGSGQSGILQVGALLLVAGAVVFVAARRRNPAAST